MEYQNEIQTLNNYVENLINVKLSKMSSINHLEKMRLNYRAKLEAIDLKIKKLEINLFKDITKELSEAKTIKLRVRGRPRKDHYPKIMPEIIINDVSVDTYEVKLEPLIVKDAHEVIFNEHIETQI